ncbi:hypothetical protein [Streptomyces sp. NPDC050534]
MTDTIHDELAERQLLPSEHVVDSGYISPQRIERAQLDSMPHGCERQ